MTTTEDLVAGADVTKGKWVCVILNDGRFLAAQGIDLPNQLDKLTGKVPPDDLLDATVAAWTAWRCLKGMGEALPESDSRPSLIVRSLIWF